MRILIKHCLALRTRRILQFEFKEFASSGRSDKIKNELRLFVFSDMRHVYMHSSKSRSI